jgi:hypothetical protein
MSILYPSQNRFQKINTAPLHNISHALLRTRKEQQLSKTATAIISTSGKKTTNV